MRHDVQPTLLKRAERWAAPEPTARWREPSTGRLTSALAPLGDLPMYPSDEGLSLK